MWKPKILLLLIGIFFISTIIPTNIYGENSVIKIGADYELSGNNAMYSQYGIKGIQLYLDKVNENGGALGQKIELVIEDNHSNPDDAKAVAENLIKKDNVIAILGPSTSKSCFYAAPVAQKNKVLLLTSTATHPDVTKAGDFIFRNCYADDFQGTIMASFALNSLKISTAAIITSDTNDYSKVLANSFKKTFTKNGGEIVAEAVAKNGPQENLKMLKKISTKSPGLIFIPLWYDQAESIIQQIQAQNTQLPILGGDTYDFPDLIKSVGNNVYFCNFYSPEYSDPLNIAFVSDYRSKYGEYPEAVSALNYDAAVMIVQAIKNAGSTDPIKVRDALAALKFNGVSGNLIFDENRNPVKTGIINEIKNGIKVLKEMLEPTP